LIGKSRSLRTFALLVVLAVFVSPLFTRVPVDEMILRDCDLSVLFEGPVVGLTRSFLVTSLGASSDLGGVGCEGARSLIKGFSGTRALFASELSNIVVCSDAVASDLSVIASD
jgi:hypothetical protein